MPFNSIFHFHYDFFRHYAAPIPAYFDAFIEDIHKMANVLSVASPKKV